MQLQSTLLSLLTLVTLAHTLIVPSWTTSSPKDLFKRKGGGGGGGRGGGSSGGSSGGSRGGSSGGGGSSGRTSPTSNTGGSTALGSGPGRGYGGGSYYGGGAAVPYRAGATNGASRTPYLLGGAALAFFPGIWLYSVYAYSWPGYYHWRNTTSNQNETGPVNCLCEEYSSCGCEANNNTQYLDSVANNRSVAYRADNGTLYINGTLPNGTTAPGGEDGAAGRTMSTGLLENSGYWFVAAGVGYAVSLL